MSGVRWIYFFLSWDKVVGLVERVCNQRGLPRLVLHRYRERREPDTMHFTERQEIWNGSVIEKNN